MGKPVDFVLMPLIHPLAIVLYVNKIIRPVLLLCLLEYIGCNNIRVNIGIFCGVRNIKLFIQYSLLTCQQSVSSDPSDHDTRIWYHGWVSIKTKSTGSPAFFFPPGHALLADSLFHPTPLRSLLMTKNVNLKKCTYIVKTV